MTSPAAEFPEWWTELVYVTTAHLKRAGLPGGHVTAVMAAVGIPSTNDGTRCRLVARRADVEAFLEDRQAKRYASA